MLRVGVGDQIVAGNDWNSSSPSYGIIRAQSYELQRVYYQGVGVDGQVAKVDVEELEVVYVSPDGGTNGRNPRDAAHKLCAFVSRDV